jgi:cysteine desulfurase
VSDLIGAHSREVIFTSCATESNNAAIAAALRANPAKRHVVTSQVEHSSVLNYCMALEKSGTPLLGQEGAGETYNGSVEWSSFAVLKIRPVCPV